MGSMKADGTVLLPAMTTPRSLPLQTTQLPESPGSMQYCEFLIAEVKALPRCGLGQLE